MTVEVTEKLVQPDTLRSKVIKGGFLDTYGDHRNTIRYLIIMPPNRIHLATNVVTIL